MKDRCSETVFRGRYALPQSCSNYGAVERGGKWYCKAHDPEKAAAKRIAQNAKYRAEQDKEEQIKADVARLSVELGVQGKPHWNLVTRSYDRHIVISFEEAAKLADRLREEGR